jgi:hypothetical protein
MRKAKKLNGGMACGPCGALSGIICLDKKFFYKTSGFGVFFS